MARTRKPRKHKNGSGKPLSLSSGWWNTLGSEWKSAFRDETFRGVVAREALRISQEEFAVAQARTR